MSTQETRAVGVSDVFGGLFNAALGAFDRRADLESQRLELAIAREQRQAEEQQEREAVSRERALVGGGKTGGGFDLQNPLVIGAIAVVGVLLITR